MVCFSTTVLLCNNFERLPWFVFQLRFSGIKPLCHCEKTTQWRLRWELDRCLAISASLPCIVQVVNCSIDFLRPVEELELRFIIHPDIIHIQTYYSEFHFPEFTSAVADMKNSVADRNNGQPRFIHFKSYLCNAKIKVSYGQGRELAILIPSCLKSALYSCAGLFIHAHLGFDWSGVWMHVDMAAPAMVSIT